MTESVHPIDLLQAALETRIARHDEEVALVELQYRQLAKRLEDAQGRIDAAEASRQVLLKDLAAHPTEEIEKAFADYYKAVRDQALAEQRYDELADRRADAKERLHVYRGDLQLARDAARDSRLKPADEEAATFRNASRQVFQIIEEERMRIARNMHDGPAQSMSNLVLQAEILERLVNKPDAILAELQEFKNSVRGALEETRQLIFDLRPMTLDDLGLVPTLRKYIKEYSDKHGMNVRFNVVGEERRLPGNIEGTLFRIIQEALANVEKHAQSGNAEVTLNLSRERVLTLIRDDGQGFDIPKIEANLARNRNLGLISMRERAELERGSLDLKSHPGKGTEIRVEFKLD
ncbi:MAG TPA: histidine kinase [Candidatus Dormibacteraeota bacterium]|nr:histidine kinase [Candidatus Dormibacteraeota bacterium]